jgi:hypothetical protein
MFTEIGEYFKISHVGFWRGGEGVGLEGKRQTLKAFYKVIKARELTTKDTRHKGDIIKTWVSDGRARCAIR